MDYHWNCPECGIGVCVCGSLRNPDPDRCPRDGQRYQYEGPCNDALREDESEGVMQ